jgi:anti-sigma factor (TIGR02949 family)
LAASKGILSTAPRAPFAGLRLGSSCRKVMAQLDDYLDGELSASDCSVIEGHLSACERCLDALDLQKSFAAALRSKLGRLPCPSESRERIMQHLMVAMGEMPQF